MGEQVSLDEGVRSSKVGVGSSVEADPASWRASDGRVPGRRGRATRQRLLDHTAAMLRDRSYRDVTVIEIARAAGTSPATFYQYFADVEAAVLVLADGLVADAEELARTVAAAWTSRAEGGYAAYGAALDVVDAFVAFWERHRPVLRVVELAAAEGDDRFRQARVRALEGVAAELAAVIRPAPGVDARAAAGVLVTMLANAAVRGDDPDVRTALARHVYWGVTGETPPAEA
jgi:AcrR family transcriptional regulator